VATSSIPALKSGLLATLQARPNLTNVAVTYGSPTLADREWIWLGDITGAQDWGAIGHDVRREDYSLTVIVSTTMESTDQQTVTERGFAILAEIETAVRTDPTIGGAVITSQLVVSEVVELEKTDGSARGVNITAQLVCMNRI